MSHPSRYCILMASSEQIEYLLQYCEENTELVNNKNLFPGETKIDRRKKWEQLTENLNCIGGMQKDYKGWQAFWKDWRYRVKKKASEEIVDMQRTGGGRKKAKTLSEQERRVMDLVGWDCVKIPNSVRLDPISILQNKEVMSEKEDTPVLHEICDNVITETVVDDEIRPTFSSEHENDETANVASGPNPQANNNKENNKPFRRSCRRRKVPQSLAQMLISQHGVALSEQRELIDLERRKVLALEKIAESLSTCTEFMESLLKEN